MSPPWVAESVRGKVATSDVCPKLEMFVHPLLTGQHLNYKCYSTTHRKAKGTGRGIKGKRLNYLLGNANRKHMEGEGRREGPQVQKCVSIMHQKKIAL